MKPSRLHYFVAEEWPTKLWLAIFLIAPAAWITALWWPLVVYPEKWTDPFVFIGCSLIAALLGYFVSIPLGWPILGPMYYDRSLKNGEPFQQGEMVQILVGPHRDHIVKVLKAHDIASWAGAHRVYVDLESESEGSENVFSSFQVLRVSPEEGAEATQS